MVKIYIGDGVYVDTTEPDQVRLFLHDGYIESNEIYLDQEVAVALILQLKAWLSNED